MILLLSIIVTIVVFVFAYMKLPKFGRLPTGERLKKIRNSVNYRNGAFQNITDTPQLTDTTFFKVLRTFLFSDKSHAKPKQQVPTLKTNLLQLDVNRNVLVWFGHSSYFIQVDGKRVLVDPVLSGSASPLPGGTKAFAGTDIYTTDDIPVIDYLFISHDHWDHLDYKTIISLKPKIKTVITGLGTGEHLERWGYDSTRIIEKDWDEFIQLDDGFTVNTVSARHFAGRTFRRNTSLWMSFVFQTPNHKIFIGGDSGYDKHFVETGKRFGPFDLAILENGQYNKSWKYIHMMPGEVLKAAHDLGAKKLLPVHSSKFALSLHNWDEPLKDITSINNQTGVQIITPRIGEIVELDDPSQTFKKWWEELE